MKVWLVMRNGEKLGRFLAEELVLMRGTLFAKREGRIIGSVASGPGLTWNLVSLPPV